MTKPTTSAHSQKVAPPTKNEAIAASLYPAQAPKRAPKLAIPVDVSATRVGAHHYGRK